MAPVGPEGYPGDSRMSRHDIADEKWARIEGLPPGRPGRHGGVAVHNRRFVDAILYAAKTGSAWRDLPSGYGKWDTAYHRYSGWCQRGRWQGVFEAIRDPDRQWLLLGGPVIRAHPPAAGANTGGADEGLGRSRGGSGTEGHAASDGLGHPVAFRLRPGRDADIAHAERVTGSRVPGAVVGGKSHERDDFAEALHGRGTEVATPPKKNRVAPRGYDEVLCKGRAKAERAFNRLKQFRRLATR